MSFKKVIKFYRQGKGYGCFSNFAPYPIAMENKIWPTTEHSKKFEGTKWEEEVRLQPSPGKAAKMGRRRDLPLRKDWESVKEQIMYDCCFQKFTQHEDLKKILLDTGDALIVEHTANDRYWGDGGDGSGKNRLGHILMKVREDIRRLEKKNEQK